MKCPFLRDASVKYCEASAYRKLIVAAAIDAGSERCSSSAYHECPAALPRLEGLPESERCPFLHEAAAEFCSAAAVPKYLPATNDLLSRCNTDGHLYCELYLASVDPTGERCMAQSAAWPHDDQTPLVAGIPVPQHLAYTANHMWLDIAGEGCWHCGIDGFAAKFLGTVEKVTFVSQRGAGRPTAVLRVNDVDIPMVFPNRLPVAAANVYLRTSPEKIAADPYGAGWLFEGVGSVDSVAHEAASGLIDGATAVHWMRDEVDRLDELVHERAARPQSDGSRFMADGGDVEGGIATRLDRETLIDLTAQFFATQLTFRRPS